jgi:Rrf2 family protein
MLCGAHKARDTRSVIPGAESRRALKWPRQPAAPCYGLERIRYRSTVWRPQGYGGKPLDESANVNTRIASGPYALPARYVIALGAVTEIALAARLRDGPVTARRVALQLRLHERSLEKTLRFLAKGRVLIALRCHQGGYRLARHPGQITVADIVRVLDQHDPDHATTTASKLLVDAQLASATRDLLEALHEITIESLVGSATNAG